MSGFTDVARLRRRARRGGNVDISSPVSIGNHDTAAWTNGVFRNLADTHARYEVPINYRRFGDVFAIEVEIVAAPSNTVAVTFGDAFSDALRIECSEGVWTILCGSRRHRFADPAPPLQKGTNTYRLAFSPNPWGAKGYAPQVRLSINGGREVSASNLAPSQADWGDVGDPRLFTHARIELRGRGAGIKSIDCSFSNPGTLIILR